MRFLGMAIPLLLAVALHAEDEKDAELKAKLDEKLKKPFVSNAAWVLGFGEAKELAAEKGKVIFAYFSRSYAP